MIRTAHFLVTSRCSLRCRFCLNAWKDQRTGRALAKAFTKDADYFQKLSIIDSLAHEGVRFLVITGGEPFQEMHLASLVRHAGNAGMQVIIQTNGERVTRGFLDEVQGHMRAIQVSLEGTRREHHEVTRSRDFPAVIRNMLLVKEAGIPLMTNFTITTHNMRCLPAYVMLLDRLKVDAANFTRLYPAGHGHSSFYDLQPSTDEMTAFYNDLSELQRTTNVRFFVQGGIPAQFFEENRIGLSHSRCGAALDEIAIQPNGDVTMCPGSATVLGNILRTPLHNILQGDRARSVLAAHQENPCGGSCLLFRQADPLGKRTALNYPVSAGEPASSPAQTI